MVRSVPAVCLCCMLLWVSTACAPKHTELLSAHGYRVSLDVSDPLIFLSPRRSGFPEAAALVVRVRDAQGQPVDGIPVRFSVEPSWTQNASLTPAETLTRNGEARAIFQANTIGVVHVMAQVDNVTHEARITIDTPPSPTGGGS
jgi:Bacterial Ig-like domain (group 1)